MARYASPIQQRAPATRVPAHPAIALQIRLGLRFEGVRETEAQADKEAEEWRQATKIKLGTDFETCTKVMLGNNRAQVRTRCGPMARTSRAQCCGVLVHSCWRCASAM